MPQRIYRLPNLRELGITYSDTHLRRLEAKGLFPKRFKLNPKGGGMFGAAGWDAREIDRHVETLIAARDSETAAA